MLVSHVHADWGHTVTSLARRLGLNPDDNGIRRLTAKLHALTPKQVAAFGVIAIGYGVLEGFEAYGLFRKRRWGEILTVVATALLFIPEVWELLARPSAFKVGALVVNAAIVVYLLYRLRSKDQRAANSPANRRVRTTAVKVRPGLDCISTPNSDSRWHFVAPADDSPVLGDLPSADVWHAEREPGSCGGPTDGEGNLRWDLGDARGAGR